MIFSRHGHQSEQRNTWAGGAPLRIALVALSASLLLTACGGGGSNEAPSGPDLVSFQGNANGALIADANNEFFGVRGQDRTVVTSAGVALTGLFVSPDGVLTRDGAIIGNVVLIAGDNGARLAAFTCITGARADIVISGSTYTVQGCTSNPGSTGNGGGTAGGSGTGTGAGVGTTSAPAPSDAYVTWNGNGNGQVVLDANNSQFKVRVRDGAVVTASGIVLNGTAASTDGSLSVSGTRVATISLLPGSGGGSVAVFVCSNGTPLTFNVGADSYSYDCGSAGGTGSSTNTGAGAESFVISKEQWERSPSGQTQVYAVYVTNTSGFTTTCTANFSYRVPDQMATFVSQVPVFMNESSQVSAIIGAGSTARLAPPAVIQRLVTGDQVEAQMQNLTYTVRCSKF